MSLKPLIRNQKIIIDDHRRGSREIKEWDSSSIDIHIDKRTNYKIDGKRTSVHIRIPLNSSRPITITKGKNERLDSIPNKLRREIIGAFSDQKVRSDFLSDLLEVLDDFRSVLDNEEKASMALGRISRHFDLEWTGDEIKSYINDALHKYTHIYTDGSGDKYFASLGKKSLKMGQIDPWERQELRLKKYFDR